MEQASWRRHLEEASERRHHGQGIQEASGGIKEEAPGRRHLGGCIAEEASLGGIMEEASQRRHHRGAIMEDTSQRRHHEGGLRRSSGRPSGARKPSQSHGGIIWGSSGGYLGVIWGPSGIIWRSSGKLTDLGRLGVPKVIWRVGASRSDTPPRSNQHVHAKVWKVSSSWRYHSFFIVICKNWR